MPTIAGFRRRGVRPQALRRFFDGLGVTKVNGAVELQQLQYAIRDDLNGVAPRVLAVTDPVRLVVEGAEAGTLDAPLWPHDVTPPDGAATSRPLPFGPELWVERADYADEPRKGWKRMSPGAIVRLRHGPVVEVLGAETDGAGAITEIRARLADAGAEPRGVVHWVEAEHALPATFRLYDRLFTVADPASADDFLTALNPESLVETTPAGSSRRSPATPPRRGTSSSGWATSGATPRTPRRTPSCSTASSRSATHGLRSRRRWLRRLLGRQSLAGLPPLYALPPATPPPRSTAASASATTRSQPSASVTKKPPCSPANADLEALFEAVVGSGADASAAGTLLVHDLRRALADRPVEASQAEPAALAAVLEMVRTGALTRNAATEAVAALVDEGGTADAVVEARGLAAVRDADALAPAVDAALDQNPDEVARYRAGEGRLFGFFVGQAMRRAGKGADPQAVRTLLRERLDRA